MEKTHMHGRKESQNLIVKLSNAHSQVAKSLKAQLLQDEALRKQKALPHCTRCSKTSQPLWNEVSIAVRPDWLIDPSWPLHFNKALVTGINTFYWGEDLEAPRSMEASSSSLLHLPSFAEGIQTRKKWLNTSWQVIDATATSKRSCWHRQRRLLPAEYFDLEGVALDCGWIFPLNRLRAKQTFNLTYSGFHHSLLCLSFTQRQRRQSIAHEQKTMNSQHML